MTVAALRQPRHAHADTIAAALSPPPGKATRDGKMVIAHMTWWPLTLAEQTNVMLDIKPEKGHRVLMQSYPGGIESGTDWYQNDAGVVLTETTIRQSPFNREGTPVAYPRAQGDPVRRQHRQGGGASFGPEQRPVHQRMADRRREEQRDRDVRAGHLSRPSCGAVRRTSGSAARKVFTGAATTRRIWTCGWNTSPIRKARPSTCPMFPRIAI